MKARGGRTRDRAAAGAKPPRGQSEQRRYLGFRFSQRADDESPALFVFCAHANDVEQWVGIRRIAAVPKGTQRILREAHWRAIKNFFGANPRNTIPNGLLIAFSPHKAQFTQLPRMPRVSGTHNRDVDHLQWGVLSFDFRPDTPEHQRPALIVDGQHRLRGMSSFDKERVPVVVVAMIDASIEEQAFQFVVINNKATRVATDNVKAIIAELDEEGLRERLLKAGVRYGEKSPLLTHLDEADDSPFYRLLDWPSNREGKKLVPLTAIEQSVRFLETCFPFLLEDNDSSSELFIAAWRGVSSAYPALWGKDDSKLMKKVCLMAVNEFVALLLKSAWDFENIDIFDTKAVEAWVHNYITQRIPEVFWSAPWGIQIQDNANVRELIKSDLETMAQNTKLRRKWSDGLRLLEAAASSDDELSS